MAESIERFDIPTKGRENIFEVFTAFREWAKRQAEAKGKKLDPKWYPEENPQLWEHRPDILEAFGVSPKASEPRE